MMIIEELTTYTPATIRDLDALMHELSSTSFCNEELLNGIIQDRGSNLYVMKEDTRIIACACLCVAHTPECTNGFVESVTVKSEYRGRHLGRQLMENLIAEARRMNIQQLHLTSSPSRIAANALYKSMGFRLHETNCYQLEM